jgi:hypothetical protein
VLQIPRGAVGGGARAGGGYAGGDADNKKLAQTKKQLDEMIKAVGAKTFYLSEGVWYDAKYKKSMDEVKVKYLSEEYFELLAKHPEVAKYFAIDSKIVVVLGGKAYRIVEE